MARARLPSAARTAAWSVSIVVRSAEVMFEEVMAAARALYAVVRSVVSCVGRRAGVEGLELGEQSGVAGQRRPVGKRLDQAILERREGARAARRETVARKGLERGVDRGQLADRRAGGQLDGLDVVMERLASRVESDELEVDVVVPKSYQSSSDAVTVLAVLAVLVCTLAAWWA